MPPPVVRLPPPRVPPATPPEALTVIVMLALAALTILFASVAFAANVYVAGVPAVPVIVQFDPSVSPEPVRLPENMAHVSGAVPPLVASAWLDALPCVTAALAPLVLIEEAALMVREFALDAVS